MGQQPDSQKELFCCAPHIRLVSLGPQPLPVLGPGPSLPGPPRPSALPAPLSCCPHLQPVWPLGVQYPPVASGPHPAACVPSHPPPMSQCPACVHLSEQSVLPQGWPASASLLRASGLCTGIWTGAHEPQEGGGGRREPGGESDPGVGLQGAVLRAQGAGAADRAEAAAERAHQHAVGERAPGVRGAGAEGGDGRAWWGGGECLVPPPSRWGGRATGPVPVASSPCERVLAMASGPPGSHPEGQGALFWAAGRPLFRAFCLLQG